eukprot:1197379-Prymnesium_polylepis.1
MSACEQLVREVAPVDHEIYDHARASVRAAMKAAGRPFRAQLRELAAAKRLYWTPRCAWRALRPHVRASPRLERFDRHKLRELAPDFNSSASCVRGDQDVMRAVWLEHGKGGRTKQGYPISGLVRVPTEAGGGRATTINPLVDRRSVPNAYRAGSNFYWDSVADAGRGL